MELSRNVSNGNVVHPKSNPLACHDDLLLLYEIEGKLRPIIGMTPRESRALPRIFQIFFGRRAEPAPARKTTRSSLRNAPNY